MNSKNLIYKVDQKHATFELANTLKSYCQKVIKDQVEHWFIDLSDCEYCDSTFLGILLLCSLELRKNNSTTKVTVLYPNKSIQSAIIEIGIDKFIEVKPYNCQI